MKACGKKEMEGRASCIVQRYALLCQLSKLGGYELDDVNLPPDPPAYWCSTKTV